MVILKVMHIFTKKPPGISKVLKKCFNIFSRHIQEVSVPLPHVFRRKEIKLKNDCPLIAQKNNYYKQKENRGSFSLPWTTTIDERHTRIFVSETVTSNRAATQ
jgi:hypothetical protein